MFSYDFCKISKITFSYRTPPVAVSVDENVKKNIFIMIIFLKARISVFIICYYFYIDCIESRLQEIISHRNDYTFSAFPWSTFHFETPSLFSHKLSPSYKFNCKKLITNEMLKSSCYWSLLQALRHRGCWGGYSPPPPNFSPSNYFLHRILKEEKQKKFRIYMNAKPSTCF